MNTQLFIKHLKIGDMIFSKKELKTCLIEQMLEYIERRIEFYELDELSELIYRHYIPNASNDVVEVVNKMHKIREAMHNPMKKQLSEEEIIFKIDEFLVFLTSTK